MADKGKDPEFWSYSDKDDWETPPDLIEDISNAVGGIDLDPCAGENTNHATENLRLEDGDDGLSEDWYGVTFVNPPFSYKSEWLEKTVSEIESGNAETVIVLTPDSTDTVSWWHKYIAPNAEVVCFCEGRISYCVDGEKKENPTFGTAISVFGDVPEDLLDMLQDWGHVVRTV
jgi:phage N-6-adenine-methyltransferase